METRFFATQISTVVRRCKFQMISYDNQDGIKLPLLETCRCLGQFSLESC